MVISMDRWKGKVAVVTGASAGIGTSIVEKLVESGLKVVGLARRKERLDELAKKLQGKPGKFYPLSGDVSKEEDVLAAFKWIKKNVGPVHILVNNAGIARVTSLVDGETKFWKEVLDTNVLGLCMATREAVRDMRENKVDGHIIHINSMAGHIIPKVDNFNVYPASKHAVTALTETLRQELNSIGSKIKITSISPGLVQTEIFDAILKGSDKMEFKEHFNAMFASAPFLQSEDVTDAVLYVLGTPPHVQVHEVMLRPVMEAF